MPDLCCPLCGGTDTSLRYQKSTLPIRQCACGMVFLYPPPNNEQLLEIYQADYYQSWGISGDDEATRAMKLGTFKRRIQQLSGLIAPGKVLDVGCATGFFLEVAFASGWEVYGVELSEYAAELARRRFGERIFIGTLEQAQYSDGNFDLITLSDLLEHVPDLRSFLLEVRRVLRPGGILMIVTPNVASLTAQLMRSRWSHYKREHLFYFSPDTIMRLLRESGFTIEFKGAAAKCLNIAYVAGQFKAYPHFLMTPLCNLADFLLPTSIKNVNFTVRCGEMLVVARNSTE
jgi:2-polyprenyl-3-methyl-5-hydroxy-6-metoxy-1,4-benzoquinol methylase